jgi:hypothetical protein
LETRFAGLRRAYLRSCWTCCWTSVCSAYIYTVCVSASASGETDAMCGPLVTQLSRVTCASADGAFKVHGIRATHPGNYYRYRDTAHTHTARGTVTHPIARRRCWAAAGPRATRAKREINERKSKWKLQNYYCENFRPGRWSSIDGTRSEAAERGSASIGEANIRKTAKTNARPLPEKSRCLCFAYVRTTQISSTLRTGATRVSTQQSRPRRATRARVSVTVSRGRATVPCRPRTARAVSSRRTSHRPRLAHL